MNLTKFAKINQTRHKFSSLDFAESEIVELSEEEQSTLTGGGVPIVVRVAVGLALAAYSNKAK